MRSVCGGRIGAAGGNRDGGVDEFPYAGRGHRDRWKAPPNTFQIAFDGYLTPTDH